MAQDDAPPQEKGAYGGDNSAAASQDRSGFAALANLPIRVRPELIVKPDFLTLYSGFFGKELWKRDIAFSITDSIASNWALTGRAPSQDEMDVITSATSQSIYTKRMSFPMTYLIGTSWLYYSARKSPRFPKNPTPANILAKLHEFRTHDSAAFKTMLFRTSFRMFFVLTTTNIIMRTVAKWNEVVTLMSDQRMKAYFQDITNLKPEDLQRRRIAMANERHRLMKTGGKSLFHQILQDLEQSSGYQGDRDQYGYDSAPLATVSSESDMAYGTSQNGYGTAAPQPSSTSDPRDQQIYGQLGSAQSSATRSSQSDPTSDFFGSSSDDDDASPTAPEYRNTNMAGMSAGSAWDRIRQQNSTQSSRSPPPRQAPMQWGQPQEQSPRPTNDLPSNEQEQYSYDRRREKDQAQAEFDNMMDAERNASSEAHPSRTW